MEGLDQIESKEVRTEAVDFSFGEILNLHLAREIVIRPEYQRLFRWSIQQRSRLIESLLLKLPLPPIFLVESDKGVLELIDGLQRISSVLQFLDHDSINEKELVLDGCDILKHINGLKFSDFNITIRLKLKRTPIRAIIIKRTGDDYIKYEMFKRLNTGGSLLSAQEIRNCSSRMISGGEEFYGAIQELAGYDSFVSAIERISDADKEKRADEELVLRYFAVKFFREKFKGNVQEWLDNVMEDFLFHRFDKDLPIEDFKKFFDFVSASFKSEAFSRQRDGESMGRLAPAYFEAVVGALSDRFSELGGVVPEQLRQFLTNAFEDPEFRQAVGPGANSKPKMEQRIAIVAKHFFK